MARFSIAVAATAACAFVASCTGGGYTAVVHFNPPTLARQARRVQLSLVHACAAQSVTDGMPPVDVIRTIDLLPNAPGSGLGHVSPGSYGLYARAFDASCHVVAAGCREVPLIAGGSDDLTVTAFAITGPTGCDAGETCVDGACLAPDAGTDAGMVEGGPPDSGARLQLCVLRVVQRGGDLRAHPQGVRGGHVLRPDRRLHDELALPDRYRRRRGVHGGGGCERTVPRGQLLHGLLDGQCVHDGGHRAGLWHRRRRVRELRRRRPLHGRHLCRSRLSERCRRHGDVPGRDMSSEDVLHGLLGRHVVPDGGHQRGLWHERRRVRSVRRLLSRDCLHESDVCVPGG